ncbi:hypothetical protein V3W47_13195 [Deinococcus sp. YIM 134068]|uniref:hypothetical protein n=1 Tax=Deinococcus lichenicola TaxID=3118910 RepID=UPI002F9529A5
MEKPVGEKRGFSHDSRLDRHSRGLLGPDGSAVHPAEAGEWSVRTRTSAVDDRLRLGVQFSIDRLATLLYGVVAVLLCASLVFEFAVYFSPDLPAGTLLHNSTTLNGEGNIPALFSVVMLLVCGCVTFLVARLGGRSAHSSSGPRYWGLLSAVLFLMAADEWLQLHETVGGVLGRVLNLFDVYAWVIPGTLLVLLFAVYFRNFVNGLPAPTRRSLCLAFFLFVGGAVGLEVGEALGFLLTGHHGILDILLTSSQEVLEMLGAVILLRTLLLYVRDFLGFSRTQLMVEFSR